MTVYEFEIKVINGVSYMVTYHEKRPCVYHDWSSSPPYWTKDGRQVLSDKCRVCNMVRRMEEVTEGD